jgi:homocysteine S-methyltransferase
MATRQDTPFRQAMTSLLVFDGAMGSLLYERGVFVTQNFEQLNVTRPEVVGKIHEDYLAAGAQIIETNTFGANSFCLDRHGLADQVGPITSRGAVGAPSSRRTCGWPADGPTGLVPGATAGELSAARPSPSRRRAWRRVAPTCSCSKPSGTSRRSDRDRRRASSRARHADHRVDGFNSRRRWPWVTPEHRHDAGDWGADVIGVNCGDGPQLALAIAERMRGAGLPLCVQPNAGLPRTVDGRLLYMATPDTSTCPRPLQLGATMTAAVAGPAGTSAGWQSSTFRTGARGRAAERRHGGRGRAHPRAHAAGRAERLRAKIAAGTSVSVEVNRAWSTRRRRSRGEDARPRRRYRERR